MNEIEAELAAHSIIEAIGKNGRARAVFVICGECKHIPLHGAMAKRFPDRCLVGIYNESATLRMVFDDLLYF